MPLHPTKYAEMLSALKCKETGVNVWLVNTGWTGGPYGIGSRMKLKYTRAMISAAMEGKLRRAANYENYHIHSVFGVAATYDRVLGCSNRGVKSKNNLE